jgi:hypothetical protein
MEMKNTNSGKLRAIGYDAQARSCTSNSTTVTRCNTAASARIPGAGSATPGQLGASNRDNIEEEFTAKKVSGRAPAGKNPLADFSARRHCYVDLS